MWEAFSTVQRLLLELHLFALFYLFGLVLNSPDFYASFPPDTSKFMGLVLFTLVLTLADHQPASRAPHPQPRVPGRCLRQEGGLRQ